MKNKALLYLILAGGAIYLLSAKKKAKGYTITVPEPEKITQAEYEQKTKGLAQKILPAVKKIVSTIKAKKAAKKAAKKVGEFPDLY